MTVGSRFSNITPRGIVTTSTKSAYAAHARRSPAHQPMNTKYTARIRKLTCCAPPILIFVTPPVMSRISLNPTRLTTQKSCIEQGYETDQGGYRMRYPLPSGVAFDW